MKREEVNQAHPEGVPQASLPRRKRFYIAGPMSGLPQFNFPAFFAAAASLKAAGYDVTSPAELDSEKSQKAALSNMTGDPAAYNATTGETWGDLLARDVKLIADEVDAVILLEDWEYSKGARLEAFVARTCGKPVYSYEKWLNDDTPGAPFLRSHKVSDEALSEVMRNTVFAPRRTAHAADLESQTFPILAPKLAARLKAAEEKYAREAEDRVIIGNSHSRPFPKLRTDFKQIGEVRITSDDATGEVRVTSDTGGQKGRKPQRTDLIPPEALLALSEVYGMGADKYDDHNYLKGYDWSLSFGALLRHVFAAEDGEWLDEESGLPHVMHAAWHCFCLFMFEKHGLGTDDRLKTVVEGLDG